MNTLEHARMQRVSVKLPEDMVEELDDRADNQDVTRSDVIRNLLDDGLNTDDDPRIQEYSDRIQELEDDLEEAETRAERLERANLLILEREKQTDALVEYVEAGFWGRLKKSIFDR